MVYDVLEVFKKRYEEKGDALILGNYTLKDGLYVKIDKEGVCHYFEAKTVKKEKIFQTTEGVKDSKAFDWFKERDYLSEILNNDTNKCVGDKKIHSINYLTFFFKSENLSVIKERIRGYFLIFLNFKKFKDKNEKEILKKYKTDIHICSRKKDIVIKNKILQKNYEGIKEKAELIGVKNYIKVFFDEEIEIYKKETSIYLALKIFNSSKYNQEIDNLIYGLSNSNLGMGGGLSNSKKPFFQQKTRASVLPFMLPIKDAISLKQFFDWLKNQKDKYPLNEKLFFNTGYEKKEFVIKEFDYIPLKKDDVERHFKTVEVKNYLRIRDKDKSIIQDYKIKELWQLEEKVNELFYNNQLVFNYYNDDIKVSSFMSKELQKLLFITKYGMNNYFRKFDDRAFENIIKKYGTAFVLDGLRNGRVFRAKNALNLKFALLGEKMDIEEIVTVLDKRLIEEGNYAQLERDEFMFLSGQWAYYLLKQSNSIDKTFSLAEHYFKAQSLKRLKKALSFDFEKYKHAIYRESKRVRKVISLIKSYESEQERLSDSDKDMFLVGFTVDNLVYNNSKKEKK